MFAVLLLCLVGIAVAQRPVPCITPLQWEARIFDVNEQQQFRAEARFSYDATYHRERVVERFDEGTQEEALDTLALFDSQIEFIYNFRARNCTRRPITRPWRDFGIRANDTSYGEAYVGSAAFPGAGILVTIWGGNTTYGNDTITHFSQWTFTGCVPVHRTTISQRYGRSHISIYDVTLGIRNPDVFIPRQECLRADEWENRYTLFGTPTNNNI